MTSMFRSTFVLTLVCLIAAALLGGAYMVTADKIEEQKISAINENLKNVFPGADEFDDMSNYYVAKKDGLIIGWAVLAESSGYGGAIKILVGIDTEKKVTGIRIMEQEETPGLGANAAQPGFYSQFQGLDMNNIKLTRDGGEVDAITGATITSRAVIDGVLEGFNIIGEGISTDGMTGATKEVKDD